ncbi:imidazolonepropionase, partial [Salmonella enterica subsp. enterica serovar Typhimurium]|nr:imidazolonepropionase [Salmonella enterica subsp. enterica serovar Typhimurium]
MTSTLLTGISELVTNDPGLGRGKLGILDEAAVVIEDDAVAWVGPAAEAPPTDAKHDFHGRAVLPGFVES